MYSLIRQLLFMMDAEKTHDAAHHLLGAMGRSPILRRVWTQRITGRLPHRQTSLFDLKLPNPIGMAAGFDKNARNIQALTAFGFGWLELGTVTPRPQPGNDRPRLFRLPDHEAIINRNGFNNLGLESFVDNVSRYREQQAAGKAADAVIGINIGKNTATAVEDATQDYIDCLDRVYPLADYVIVNVSSPNSPGLRDLQHVDALEHLLSQLKDRQRLLQARHGFIRPLAIKLAPDLDDDNVAGIAGVISNSGIDGVFATNTTIERDTVQHHRYAGEAGGLSGRPLRDLSAHICSQLRQALPAHIPVVACGGIDSASIAQERLDSGCAAVQLYTGLIYRGPGLIGKMVRGLSDAD